ncbi:MAG: serine/threonine protein kinase, partial [Deltaproteobacteria bacterium]|nr:serine/threonine protein kinase [Deltaproteobacteria bacterium]
MLGHDAAPAGTCFGPYEVVRVLGAGGMGTVYEGRHRSLGKRVAIKTLHAPLATDATVVARFVNEARAASRLSHPNVADVYDVGVESGQPYLVIELLRGETLRDLLDREQRMSPARALAVILPIAGALDAAHRDGVVHRDVKPENVFLARPRVGPPVPKLLDFGIAKLRQEGDSLTGNSDVFGTPYYMSPEQTRGAKHVDARSDQYSLAAVLYECVTGARPFDAEHVVALICRIQVEPLVAPRVLVPSLPEGLDAVLVRAMSREPEARFPSAAAFAAALLPFADATTRA